MEWREVGEEEEGKKDGENEGIGGLKKTINRLQGKAEGFNDTGRERPVDCENMREERIDGVTETDSPSVNLFLSVSLLLSSLLF